MLQSSLIYADYYLPEDKLPECNLFTLFIRKQTQSLNANKFDNNISINNYMNNESISNNSIRRSSQISKSNHKQDRKNNTSLRNVHKNEKTVQNKQQQKQRFPSHHQSVNIVENKEEFSSIKSQIKNISQKSRDQSLFIEDLQNLSVNQSTDFTLRTQSSYCRTRKNSMISIAYDSSSRNIVQRAKHNLSQNRNINTEQTTQNSLERSKSNNKTKKMSRYQTSFIVYKSNKPLTTFQDFQLISRPLIILFYTQRQRSSSATRNNNCNNSYNQLNNLVSHNMSVQSQIENKENRDQRQTNTNSQPIVNIQLQRSLLHENQNNKNKQVNESKQNKQNPCINKQTASNTKQNQSYLQKYQNNKAKINKERQNVNQLQINQQNLQPHF